MEKNRRKERICTYIDGEIYAKFKRYCTAHRKSMSTAVQELLIEKLTEEKYLEMGK